MNYPKIALYLLLSFGISWLASLAMYLLHIKYGSVAATAIIAFCYMPAPAIATFVVQKLIYKQSFVLYGWSFDRRNLRWFLLTPLFFVALLLLSFGMVALLGNTNLIPEFGQLSFLQDNFNANFTQLVSSKVDISTVTLPQIPAPVFFVLAIIQGIVAGCTINVPFMFGEEFGWRGLLLKETQPMGFAASNLFIGVIWGLWHVPIVLLGHNYPHYPYFGLIMMCLFTTAISPIFAYVRLKTQSVLGACLLHGMINATGVLFGLFIVNFNELYSSIAGWAGVLAGIIITAFIYLLDAPFVKNYANTK
ncbi:MAG: CPBP family intramembrane metalloprotease [Sphingobacteriales bacterium]|jgi:membrane protease YdiL (CAAX protease family)|nr:CPBP family intramembrane metalloprotease [Sphingobacteriales bacterium]